MLLKSVYDFAAENKSLEIDVKAVLDFSIEYYEANLIFPSVFTIKEKFNDFGFTEERFIDIKDSEIYMREKEKEFRNLVKQGILVDLLNDKLPLADQMIKVDKLNKTIQSTLKQEDYVTNVDDLNFTEVYSRIKGKGGGIRTNVPDIDELTGGITSGKLMVLIAPPKSFKTTFAINMCYINLLEPGNNSLFVTLEIPIYELYFKMLVRHAYKVKREISVRKTLKGGLNEEEEQFMNEMDKTFHEDMKSKLLMLGNQDIRLNTLSEFKYQLKELIEENKLSTIYIDFIQLFSNFQPKGFRDKYEFLNELVSTMRGLSIDKDCRFIILSQLTKEGVKTAIRTEGVLSPTDSADISALMRECYYMISLFSNDNLKGSNQLKTQLLYHRDGETYTDPKVTFVIPQYFVVGDIDLSVQNIMEVDETKTTKDETGVNTIDLFT